MELHADPVAARLSHEGVAYAPQIVAAARHHGLDPALLAAVAAQETGGPGSNAGRNVVGDGGHGRGLFQIDDRWHAFARSGAAMDPGRNAEYAAGMIAGLLRRYGGNVRQALSAYNAGDPNAAGTATTWGDGSRLSYADSVLRHLDRLDGGEPLTESARAEQPTAAQSAGAPLLALAQSLGQPISPPRLPPSGHAHAAAGRDATGHANGRPTDYDSYVNGAPSDAQSGA